MKNEHTIEGTGPTKARLDDILLAHHGYPTRSRARDAIKRNCVFLNGVVLQKPGQTLPVDCAIEIRDVARSYVSRAALKLKRGLSELKAHHREFDITGKTALDLGASTGGFVQTLLENDIGEVFAVDVGHDQLHDLLANDPRVTNLEGLNARDLTSEYLGGKAPQLIVSDLSFISLKLALPPSLELADDQCWGIFLIKPQFEVGRENVSRGGIIRDERVRQQCVEDLTDWMNAQSPWHVLSVISSPISGGDGNLEFLMLARNFKDE